MRPKVDIGVVTWNTADLTVSSLRNLLDADHGCDLRILVHDNGSSDGTVAALSEHVPEAEVEAGRENLGFGRAMNRLFERSSSSWFFALNSDAWPEPGALAALVASAERHPRAAAVAPKLLRPDDSMEHSTHPFPSLMVAGIDVLGGRRWMRRRTLARLLLEGAWDHDRPRSVDWAVGAALLMRKEALAELGGFDERFFMYVEDLEWCWRARGAGWEVQFEPSAVVRHLGNASGEKRWGSRRFPLEAAYLRTLLPEMMGPTRALAYRGLQAIACGEQLAIAKAKKRSGEAGAWRLQLKAHLGLEPPPPVGDSVEPDESPALEATDKDTPVVAVVVPTCGRSFRLPRLMRALEAQTFDREQFEVVIVDDGSPDDTQTVLEKLKAGSDLQIRLLRTPERRGPAAARNLGWRSTSAHFLAFTDDDCVPDPAWLSSGVLALDAKTEARMVVGRTEPPPEQLRLASQPYARSLTVNSARFYETCNVFYRRQHIAAVGGFDERFRRPSGEDTHLGLAVTAMGVEAHYVPEALVHHDVRTGHLGDALQETLRWVDLPLVIRDRPWVRRSLVHRWVFWRPSHPATITALLGLLLTTKRRTGLLLLLPWVKHRLWDSPVTENHALRLRTLPGVFVLDLCEVLVMARGSLRHRTILL